MSRRLAALATLPAAIAIVVALTKMGEKTVDDAFITFRYADALVAGQGLTFNPGERVEGYSSLLYLLLVAAGRLLGLAPVLSANFGNLLGAAAASFAAFHLVRHLLADRRLTDRAVAVAAVCAGILVGLSDGFVNYGLLGLETAFAGGLCAVALWRALEEDARGSSVAPSAILLGLLAITRPDGILPLLGMTAVGVAGPGFGRAARRAVGASILPLAQLGFRLAYYQAWLPNTFYAKVWPGPGRYALGWQYVSGYLQGIGAPLLAAGLLGSLLLRSRRKLATLASVAAGGLFFGLYSGGDYYTSHRFLVPTSAVLLALLGAGSAALAERLNVRAAPILVVLLTAATIAWAPGYGAWRRYVRPAREVPGRVLSNLRALDTPSETLQVRVGRFLHGALPSDATLTVGDCGRIPYFSKLRVVDSLGLMDAHVARAPGRVNEKLDVDYLLGRNTDFFLLRQLRIESYPRAGGLRIDHVLIHDPRFQAGHVLRGYFPWQPHALFLFGREDGVIEDLVAGVVAGRVPTRGLVEPAIDHPPPDRSWAEPVLAAIADRPFELYPPDDALARRARFLWEVPSLRIGRSAVLEAQAPGRCVLEVGLRLEHEWIDVTDSAGRSTRIAGAGLPHRVAMPAGAIRITAPEGATLLAPRLLAP